MPSSGDLYRSPLDQILDQRHELIRLAGLIDWDRFDQELAASTARSDDPRSRHA